MHKVPAKSGLYELVEKRSRFITYCEKVTSNEEFKYFLSRLKQKYPDARHYCYGFRIGPLNHANRGFSDDGEPSGTAGMPILNVIDHSEFSDIAIIVVRYFGGTKLGTGGLARAYSQAANTLLQQLEWVKFQQTQKLSLCCDFPQEHQVRYLINQLGGDIISVDYQHRVMLMVELPETADLSTLTLYRINRDNN
jgi:uncharacterized YigZ family protein